MDELPSESEDIAIRCPGCGQRFKVGPDLQGRMVECGSCDQRFRVEEDVMIRQRKVYPGEREDLKLEQFSRVPMNTGEAPTFQQAIYEAKPPNSVAIEPTSPFRIILGAAGVTVAIIVALILMFAGSPGGMLDGTPLDKRLVLAGFTAVLTGVLLLVANPHGRMKAAMVGLAFAASLLAVPFFFKEGVTAARARPGSLALTPREPKVDAELEAAADPFAAVKADMTYTPMAKALEGYGPTKVVEGKTAVGIWLRDLRDYNKLLVVDYLIRSTSAADSSWLYPRDTGEFLMVLLDVDPDLKEIEKLCGRFGEVVRVIEELQVVEVAVDNEIFVQGKQSKLQDPNDPAFYELNRRELESIDLQRADEAVRRLISAEPKLFRSDIVRRMHELLLEGDERMKKNVAKALAVWAEEGDGSVDAVRSVAEKQLLKDGKVPSSVIAFLVRNEDPGVIPLIAHLWARDAKDWEALYGDLGQAAEDSLLAEFQGMSPILQLSAIRILSRVGTAKSLPVLKEARKGAQSEIGAQLDMAIIAIGKRQ